MSLQVWLPLNGDLTSQGLSNVKVINSGATVDNNGKIGKCYNLAVGNYLGLDAANINNHKYSPISCALWIYPTQNDSTERYILGCWESGGCGFYIKSQKIGFYIYVNGYPSCETPTTITLNTWHHICCTYDETIMRLYLDGQEVATNPVSGTITYNSTCPWEIGGNPGTTSFASGNFAGKINDVRIYDHALSAQEVKKLARGLILHYPLSSPSDVLVSSGYQQLEYLESTGTQYIDTGKIPQDTYEYKFKYALSAFDAYKGPFCAYSAEAANTVRLIANNGSNANALIYFNCRASAGGLAVTGLTSAVNQIVEGSLSKKSYYLKNITSNIVKSDSSSTDLFPTKGTTITANMCLFGYSGYISQSRIYYFDTYNNGVCIQKLVPAKRLSDNVLGMYDVITKAFFTNAGTGTFTAGPNALVSSPVYDISGFKNHGTVVGNLTAAADTPRYKSCTVFDGSNAAINAGRGAMITDTISISCWGYMDNWANYTGRLWSCLESGGWGLRTEGTKLYCNFGTGTTSNTYQGVSSTIDYSAISAGWHFFVVTYDGLDLKLYIDNGQPNITNAYTTKTPIFYHTNNVLWLGAEASSSAITPAGNYLNGKISDFRIYATALNDDDVAELYALGKV